MKKFYALVLVASVISPCFAGNRNKKKECIARKLYKKVLESSLPVSVVSNAPVDLFARRLQVCRDKGEISEQDRCFFSDLIDRMPRSGSNGWIRQHLFIQLDNLEREIDKK